LNRTANTITQFRQKVLTNGGIQQVSKYLCTFADPLGETLQIYPESVTLPQRSFVQVPFSYWGPAEQIPIRREYGECAMTFIIYQDWLERKYFERWMDLIIPTHSTDTPPSDGIGALQAITGIANPFNNEVDASKYTDYSNSKSKQLGSIVVYTLQADGNHTINDANAAIYMQDAYPVSITPTSLSSEATGYGTFVVIFAFRQYSFY
jgi:hypothetical protein